MQLNTRKKRFPLHCTLLTMLFFCCCQEAVRVPSTLDAKITINPPVIPTASNPKPFQIHFRQSTNSDSRQPYSQLRAQILAKAQNIVTPLQNSYPEAIKFLSFLLKQIVDSNMRAEEEKPSKTAPDGSFEPRTTAAVEIIHSSEEYPNKRPEKFGDDDLDDTDLETTTAKLKPKPKGNGLVVSKEIDYSEQVETEDFSFTQNEGLSISIETTKTSTSFTRPKTTTMQPTTTTKLPPKPSKHKNSKSKKNNKNDKLVPNSRSKKKIKDFNDLQQELEKELSAKQEKNLRNQKEIKELPQKIQIQVEEETEEEEATKSEIEKIIKEVKNQKRLKSSGSASSVSKDDKKDSIRKLIEEILSKEEKEKVTESKISKRKSTKPQIDYNDAKKKAETSEEDEETESENDKTTIVSKKNPKPKIKKPTEEKKTKFEKSKESYEIEIESEVKKKVKHTVHKQTTPEKITTEIRLTKLAAEKILDKNFKIDEKVFKKGRKTKNTTPFTLVTIKTKTQKTTRQRAIELKPGVKSISKYSDTEYENTSTDTVDSVDSCNSESSKEKTFTVAQRIKKGIPKAFVPPYDSNEESPMLLPPAMADFQLATKDRIITTVDPQLRAVEAEMFFAGDEARHDNYDKLATRGIMTIDDLNIQMGIPEEWAFRRDLSSNVSSLEAFIKAEQ